jgi:hypothetical protein
MAEWIYFIHPPREDFAATMTDEEKAVWGRNFERLQGLMADGVMVLVGPTLGPVNTGIGSSRRLTRTPAGRSWRTIRRLPRVRRGGLRPFRVSLLRGRD